MTKLTALTPAQQARNVRMFNGRRPLKDPERNALVREALKNAYPDTKFRVINGFHGHVKVVWTDGPAEHDVHQTSKAALTGTCNIYSQSFGVITDRDASLEAAISSLVEAWEVGDWMHSPNGVLNFRYQTSPHRADSKPYTPEERVFYAAVAAASGVTPQEWDAAVALDRKRVRDPNHHSRKRELYRTVAETLMSMGDALRTAATL